MQYQIALVPGGQYDALFPAYQQVGSVSEYVSFNGHHGCVRLVVIKSSADQASTGCSPGGGGVGQGAAEDEGNVSAVVTSGTS